MMIRWWKHSQKGVTDRQTDGQTENTICRAAWSQLKTTGHVCFATSSFVHHFVAIGKFKLELQSGNAQFESKSSVTLKFDGWPWNTIGHLFYVSSSFVHHFIIIGEFKLELQFGNAEFGSKSTIFFICVTSKIDLWPWKAIGHLFYATSSFVHHFVVIGEFKLELVQKRPIWFKFEAFLSRLTLRFDGWPWTRQIWGIW